MAIQLAEVDVDDVVSDVADEQKAKLFDHPFATYEDATANLDALNIKYFQGKIELVSGTEYPPQVLNACDYLCDEFDFTLHWLPIPSDATPNDATVDPETMAELEARESTQETEATTEPAAPETPAPAAPPSPQPTPDIDSSALDLLSQISNAELRCKRAEWVVIERKEALKEAKEEFDGCVAELRKIAAQAANDSKRTLFNHTPTPAPAPSETVEATDVAPDAGIVVSNARSETCSTCGAGLAVPREGAIVTYECGTTEDAACGVLTVGEKCKPPATAWRTTSIDTLGLTPSLTETLRKGDIATLGELADLIERCETGDHWPKGVGKAKRTTITDALIAYQNEQASDSTSVPVTVVDDNGETVDWGSMTHAAQVAWLNARAVWVEEAASRDPELSTVDALDLRNTENEIPWQEGVVAFEEGDLASNCPYGPGEDCDAWLTGWLWAEKREEEKE